MISILIPVYNCDVTGLVDKLQKQCSTIKMPYEILVFDDRSKASIRQKNSILSSYFGVNYTELSQNLGRAKIRNWLAKSASFDHLIFLDCDSRLTGRRFVKTYLQYLNKADVVAGGRSYGKSAPRARSKRLHWLYGKKRESRSVNYRNRHPWIFFHTNNFMVRKDIMLKYKFDEELLGYGYEDLAWAERLKSQGLKILHIKNEIRHGKLEKNTHFLVKAKESIDNLLRFGFRGWDIPSRLHRFARYLLNTGMEDSFLKFYKLFEKRIEKNLLSKNPSLWALDLYKLNYYLKRRRQMVEGVYRFGP